MPAPVPSGEHEFRARKGFAEFVRNLQPSAGRMGLAAAALAIGGAAGLAEAQTSPGFYTLAPCRVVDTRNAPGPLGGPALIAGASRTFGFAGVCGVPAGAQAVAVNVTVVQPTTAGHLRIYPGGGAAPLASSINYPAGWTRANSGMFQLGPNGDLAVLCVQPSGTAHLVVDVSGYFAGAPPVGGARWSRRFGDSADDRSQALAADSLGNVAVAGHLDGTTNFGGGSVSSYVHPSMGPTVDIFVAAYSPSGTHLWSRVIGADSAEEAKGVATDDSRNVLVTGYQGSYSVDFGGGPQYVRAGNDIFVAKYSPTGAWIWSKTIGGNGFDQGNAIAADGAGNVLVTGYMSVSTTGVDFGGGALFAAGAGDVFLVKYSPTGGHVWSKSLGGAGNDTGMAVGTDGSGNVFIAGSFEGSVNFGGGALNSAGLRDIFVAAYSANGAHLWSKRLGSSGDDVPYSLAVDGSGSVNVTGKFQGSVNFGGGSLSSAGGDDVFLVRLQGSNGAHVWSKRFGAGSADTATSVDVDGSGNVVIAGYYSGSVDFGGGALSSLGNDVFVAKYTSGGAHIWSRRYGNADSQLADGVAVAPSGDVTVAGFFAYSIDFGSGLLTSAGAYDAFIANIGP